MRQIKKTLSIFMAALFVMAGFLGAVTANAATVTVPKVNYVGVSHSPLVVGDTEKFTVTAANYTGDVQYKAYLYSEKTKVWTALTSDYSAAVDAKTPYVLPETSAFQLGKYKLSVWVKKAGTVGTTKTALGSYDSYYVANLNCVTKDNSNRVYATGAAKFETNGLTFKFNGIENIGGIAGPYTYRLHIYDPSAVKEATATTNAVSGWTHRVTEYATSPSYTFKKAGTYMVVVHANTVNSSTWKKYQSEVKTVANQGSTYGTYEAWKTILVTVSDSTLNVFNTTVAPATFGSTVNVTMTAEGIKEFPTATQYQILNGTSAISAPTKLATATTVFPAKVLGDKVNVKLMNASNVEVKIIEVELGKPGTIAVVPVVKAEVKATVKPATFGTSVTVTSTQVGATKFQILDGTNAISAIADLGSSTTVFPGKVAGDKINVKLYNAAGIVVATSEAVLVAGQ